MILQFSSCVATKKYGIIFQERKQADGRHYLCSLIFPFVEHNGEFRNLNFSTHNGKEKEMDGEEHVSIRRIQKMKARDWSPSRMVKGII